MADFFQQYFVDPIVTQGVAGYNIYNTPVYAVLFAVAVIGAYKLLKKLDIKINGRFLIGIVPFILSGGVWRVVRDSNIIPSPLLVTPLIYMSIFVVTIAALLVAVFVERRLKISYHKTWSILGIVFLASGLAIIAPIGVQNPSGLAIIAVTSAVWAALIFGAHKLRNKIKALSVFTSENSALLFAHMFDATTTFTALQFFTDQGYYEQHVVSNAVIGVLGPVGQFVLKLVVLIPVLWLLDKELHRPEDRQLRGFIKVAILILGLALGTRNMLRLTLGV